MNKHKKFLGTTISAGVLLITASVVQSDDKPHYALAENQSIPEEVMAVNEAVQPQEKPDPQSIELNPGMYIPEESSLRNQKVDEDDVKRTMNLGPLKLSKSTALAELGMGIEVHLQREEETLSYDTIEKYNQKVIAYSKLVQETYDVATDPEEVEEVAQQFREWVTSYKNKIDEEFAERARLEEERLKREQEQQQQQSEQKPVNVEVVQSTMKDSKITMTDKVNYSLPNLGDEYLTYMPYTAITAKTTPHYRLQQLATTNSEGYRVYEDAICVALASSFGTQIGTIYDITFKDGKSMRAILADNKSDKHTDVNKQYRDATGKYDGSSGNIVEIVFDVAGYDGMNAVNRKINSDYPAHVKSITKVGVAKGFEK